MQNGKEKKLTVLNRKADFSTIMKEFIANFIIIYLIYGALDNWNPLHWSLVSKIMALFFLCIYYPYRDAKRAIRKQQEDER